MMAAAHRQLHENTSSVMEYVRFMERHTRHHGKQMADQQ